jgi:Trichohyalin-plectin-homology domain
VEVSTHFTVRLNCDELRQVESRLRVKKVTEERSAQLDEKVVCKQAEQKEKEYYEGLWEKERQKKVDRENKDFNQAQERNHVQMVVLKEQIQQFKQQALKHEQLKYEEARLMVILLFMNRDSIMS